MLNTPPLVVTLASDRLAMFEFGITAEFFALARPELDFVPYRFAVAAADPPPLRGLGGIRVDVDGGLELLREANLIVVPGWRDLDETPRPEITARAARGRATAARASRRSARARFCWRMPACSTAAARRRTGATPNGSRGCFPTSASSRTCCTSTRAT